MSLSELSEAARAFTSQIIGLCRTPGHEILKDLLLWSAGGMAYHIEEASFQRTAAAKEREMGEAERLGRRAAYWLSYLIRTRALPQEADRAEAALEKLRRKIRRRVSEGDREPDPEK